MLYKTKQQAEAGNRFSFFEHQSGPIDISVRNDTTSKELIAMNRLDYTDSLLTYSAVIGHCYELSGFNSLGQSVEYGRKSGLLDDNSKLSPLGSLVGKVILTKHSI